MPAQQRPAVMMEEVTDPEEIAKAQAQRERFDRNWAWFQAHVPEIYSQQRGKCICIAGEEIFAADTPKEAIALATAAHPEDEGRFVHYIPREKVIRSQRTPREAGGLLGWAVSKTARVG